MLAGAKMKAIEFKLLSARSLELKRVGRNVIVLRTFLHFVAPN